MRSLSFLSFVRQEGDWVFVVRQVCLCSAQALRRHGLVCKEDHHLRLNGFLLGLSILRII